jgi:hypothetical protein
VKQIARIVLMVMLLAALPLRGYAGVLVAQCEGHHGGAAAAQEHAHEDGDDHHHDSGEDSGGAPHAASVCSVCASCSAGAGLAAPSIQDVVVPLPGASRISFLDRHLPGFVPEHLERPPLSL